MERSRERRTKWKRECERLGESVRKYVEILQKRSCFLWVTLVLSARQAHLDGAKAAKKSKKFIKCVFKGTSAADILLPKLFNSYIR